EAARKNLSQKAGPVWHAGFETAKRDFNEGYERSGEKSNSLTALGPLLAGWGRAIFQGLLKPASKTAATTGSAVGEFAVTPVGAVISVVGRTIQSIGLTVYY